MKLTRKLLSLLLCLALILSLAVFTVGCGDDSSSKDDDDEKTSDSSKDDKDKDKEDEEDEKATDEDLIIGEWMADVDMGSLIKDEIGDDEMGEYFDFDGLTIGLVFTFEEDGTVSTAVDENSLEDLSVDLEDAMYDGLLNFAEAMAEEQDYASADEMFAEMGYDSTDEAIEEALQEMDMSDMFDEMSTDLENEGVYKLEDGKLYIADDEDLFEDDEYIEYKLSKKSLKLTDVTGDDSDEFEVLLPLEFEKVS